MRKRTSHIRYLERKAERLERRLALLPKGPTRWHEATVRVRAASLTEVALLAACRKWTAQHVQSQRTEAGWRLRQNSIGERGKSHTRSLLVPTNRLAAP